MPFRTLTELAQHAYRALNDDNLDAFLEVVHPEVEFGSLIAEAEEETFKGHEGARRWWQQVTQSLGIEYEMRNLEDRGRVGIAAIRVAAEVRGLKVDQAMWQVVLIQDGLARWWQTYRSYEEAAEVADRLESGETGTAGPSHQGDEMNESNPDEPDQESGENLEPSEEQDPSQAEGEESAQEELSQTGEEETGPSGVTSPPDSTEDATRPPSNPETDEGKAEAAREEFEQAGGGH